MCFFFFIDAAPPEFYPLSLPDPLPICPIKPFFHPIRMPSPITTTIARSTRFMTPRHCAPLPRGTQRTGRRHRLRQCAGSRSEEHTSELQSQSNLVCRLLLERQNKRTCP